MDNIAIWIWTVLIFASIGWYAFLLFYVGYKGGVEINDMTKSLEARNTAEAKKTDTP